MAADPMTKSPFGTELRRLRVAAGKRQREVAAVLGGVSVPYVHDIERGNRNPPPLEKIHELANLFNQPDQADYLAELAVEQRGVIHIGPESSPQRRMLVVLERRIREGKVTKAIAEKIMRLVE